MRSSRTCHASTTSPESQPTRTPEMKMEPGSSSLGGDRGGGRAQARCSPPPLQAEHEGETHTVQVAPDIKSHLTFSSSPPSYPGFRTPPHPRFLLPQAADLAVSTEAFAAAEHHLVNHSSDIRGRLLWFTPRGTTCLSAESLAAREGVRLTPTARTSANLLAQNTPAAEAGVSTVPATTARQV